MAHQPIYPPEAYVGPDSRVTKAQFDRLVEITNRVSLNIRGAPARQVRRLADGWTVFNIGLKRYEPQLPPVVDEAVSS